MAQPEIPGNGVGIPRMPFGSDGTNWIALLVDALGRLQVDANVDNFPADPATQTTLASALTALQKIDDLQNALGSVATDLLRVEAKGGDKIFGFESIVEEEVSNTNLSAGTNEIIGTAVPSGKIWKITAANLTYIGTITSVILVLKVIGLAVALALIDERSITSAKAYVWNGEVNLQSGDYLSLLVYDATAGDDAYLRYAGVQMNAP